MKFSLSAVALMICLSPSLRAADEGNPYANAKVGDWTEYKTVNKVMGMTFESTSKMVVTAKTDKQLTYKVTSKQTLNGKEFESPPQDVTIDLTAKYDPTQVPKTPEAKQDVKMEKTEGKEKIKVGGKEFDCTWTNIKTTIKQNDMVIETEMKTWISKDVPLGGAVKTEVKSKGVEMTTELIGHGSK